MEDFWVMVAREVGAFDFVYDRGCDAVTVKGVTDPRRRSRIVKCVCTSL